MARTLRRSPTGAVNRGCERGSSSGSRGAKGRRGVRPDDEEIVEDFLVVERVAPGRIWFRGGVGPIRVPEAASAVARPGWTVNIVIGRRGSAWDVLEVGNVYPETLA